MKIYTISLAQNEGLLELSFLFPPGVGYVGGFCWEMSAPLRALHIPDSKSNAERQTGDPAALLR